MGRAKYFKQINDGKRWQGLKPRPSALDGKADADQVNCHRKMGTRNFRILIHFFQIKQNRPPRAAMDATLQRPENDNVQKARGRGIYPGALELCVLLPVSLIVLPHSPHCFLPACINRWMPHSDFSWSLPRPLRDLRLRERPLCRRAADLSGSAVRTGDCAAKSDVRNRP